MKSTIEKIKSHKQQSGITLIVLVVTIISLLILTSISMYLINNSDGIISKAIQASDEYTYLSAKEKVQLALQDAKFEKYAGVSNYDLSNIIQQNGGDLEENETGIYVTLRKI